MVVDPRPPQPRGRLSQLASEELTRLQAPFTEAELDQLIAALEDRFLGRRAVPPPAAPPPTAPPAAPPSGGALGLARVLAGRPVEERAALIGELADAVAEQLDARADANDALPPIERDPALDDRARVRFSKGRKPPPMPRGVNYARRDAKPLDLDTLVSENVRIFSELMGRLSGTEEPANRSADATGARTSPHNTLGPGTPSVEADPFEAAPPYLHEDPPGEPVRNTPKLAPAPAGEAARGVAEAPGRPAQLPPAARGRMFANLPFEGFMQLLEGAELTPEGGVPVSRTASTPPIGTQLGQRSGFTLEAEPRPNMQLAPNSQPGEGVGTAGRLPLDAITRVLRRDPTVGAGAPPLLTDITDAFFEYARSRLPSAVGKTLPAFGTLPQLADLVTRFQLAQQFAQQGLSPIQAADPTLDPRRFAGDPAYRDAAMGIVQS